MLPKVVTEQFVKASWKRPTRSTAMQEKINFIFEIIKNYHVERLINWLEHDGAALLATNEHGMLPLEFALRKLLDTRESKFRSRLLKIIRVLLAKADELKVLEKAMACTGGRPLIQLALTSHDVDTALKLVAILHGLDEKTTERLRQIVHITKNDKIDDLVSKLDSTALMRLTIYLYKFCSRQEVSQCLLAYLDKDVIQNAQLEINDQCILHALAIQTGNNQIKEMFDYKMPTVSGDHNPLYGLIAEGLEREAIALIRQHYHLAFPSGTISGFFQFQVIRTSPLQEAVKRKMYGFVRTCLENYDSFRVVFESNDFLDALINYPHLAEWLLQNPDLFQYFQRLEHYSFVVLSRVLFAFPQCKKLLRPLWPLFVKSYAHVNDGAFYISSLDSIMRTSGGKWTVPDEDKLAYLLMNIAFCQSMPTEMCQNIFTSLTNTYWGRSDIVKAICAVGVSPKFIRAYLTRIAVMHAQGEQELQKREFADMLYVYAMEMCDAAFSGTHLFLQRVDSLTFCPYLQHLCLSALGDDFTVIIEEFLNLPNLPIDLVKKIEGVSVAFDKLRKNVPITTVPSLKELMLFIQCRKVGLRNARERLIDYLVKKNASPIADYFKGSQPELYEHAVKLLVIISKDYVTLGRQLNPISVFAMLALLEHGNDYSWFEDLYEVEDDGDDDDQIGSDVIEKKEED
jgi:hypothetical protein